ncbi:MAG: PASTA domain-containing protein [Deltaproteobacteria bacterium]|nr:PASTA domain-containing protein [Deltaproteobacteria bacterium]
MSNTSNKKNRTNKRQAEPDGAARDWGHIFLALVAFGFLLVWGLLWSRFYVLQVVEGPEYAARAQRQHITAEILQGKRGSIFDRNGNVLATSVESYSLSARPSEIVDFAATCAFLAKTLGATESKIAANLRGKKGFVWVARKISDRKASDILESELPGLYLQKEYERVYPYKHLAGQLLGFVGMDDKGLEGLEAAFDERLSGQELRKIVQRDGRGGRLYLDGREEADDLSGQNVHLTIDVQIQYFAEAALAKTVNENQGAWGGCLVLDVSTGDILAWAHYPYFNPNAYGKYSDLDRRNKLALDALEHGSTVKPFLVAAALQEGKIRPDSMFFCENGKWKVRGHVVKDTRPHADLSVEQILRYSSNIGSGKIGLELGAASYGGYLQSLGFGQRTGLPLIGESPGIMRNPAKWPESDLVASSFGQSFSASSLQIMQAYFCLASGGLKKPMQLVMEPDLRARYAGRSEQSGQAGQAGQAAQASLPGQTGQSGLTGTRVFSEETVAETLTMLKSVVQSDDGGGRQARIAGLEISGKTGTAQKAEQGVYGAKRVASFVGMVPAEKPRYLVMVIVDEPKKSVYGSSVAAPAFREILTHTLAYNGLTPEESASMFAGGAPVSDLSGDVFDPLTDLAAYAQNRARQDAENKASSRLGVDGNAAGVGGADDGDGDLASLRVQVGGDIKLRQDPAAMVPDVRGMSVRSAVELFAHRGIMPVLKGQGGTVVRQSPAPGSAWPGEGRPAGDATEYVLWLEESIL